MHVLRSALLMLLALSGLLALDLGVAALQLSHPVPDPGRPVLLAAVRWALK